MATELADIKARFFDLLIETQPDELARLNARTEELLKKQITDPQNPLYGGWGDVTDANSDALSQGGATFGQLASLAQAWASPQCKYAGDPEVAKRINLATRFYTRIVHRGCAFPNNWWAWQIGIPRHMGNTLILASDAFENDVRDTLIDSFAYLVENIRTTMTGANAMWGGMNHLRYGLITEQTDHIALSSQWAARECEIRPVNGILSDYAYSFHGMAVHMGYGRSHFADVGEYVYVMGDTQWQLPQDALSNYVNWLLEFVQWTIVGDGIDPFIIGREISRGEQALLATLIINGALLASSAPIPRRDEVLAYCRQALNDGLKPTTSVAVQMANQLTVAPSGPLYGTRYWPVIEYFAARRPTFTAAVKMSSTNTKSWFSIRNENIKGHHTSDGHLILRTTKDAFQNNVIPTQDWDRLTGITRTDGIHMPKETEGQSPFVCGKADGHTGCCGVDFKITMENGPHLFAKKSTFFIDNAIITLGSNIESNNPNPVETIIRQVALPEGSSWTFDQSTEINGTRILTGHDCVYLFLENTPIETRIEKRSGRWSDINLWRQPEPNAHTRTFAFITTPHGTTPQNEGYAIIYLPGQTAQQATDWWHTNPIQIIQKDNQVHSIHDTKNNKTLTVRWGEGAEIK